MALEETDLSPVNWRPGGARIQRLLHILDMRGRVLEQTHTLTDIGTQLGDLAFGPKAGTRQPVRMKPLPN